MRIRISGRAVARRGDTDAEVLDPAVLVHLDGRGCDDDTCAPYVSESLARIGLTEGAVRLRHDAAGGLRVVTEYGVARPLKPAELKRLTEETVGQWSDGIGEGAWTDFPDLGVWVDVFPDRQAETLEVTQWDDGVAVPRPKPSPLLAAAKSGNLARVAKLLDAGEDPNPTDRDGFSPLDHALYGDHLDVARLLIERGADLNAREGKDFSPLTTATIRGHAGIVRLLLERGADVNGRLKPDEPVEYGPLKMACNRHKLEVARVLVEFGADVHDTDANGYTPLLMCGPDDVELARLLLERGADPQAPSVSGGMDRTLRKNLGL